MFPKLFARIAAVYRKRYGLAEEQLARVAVKNHAHARLNPLAQMRDSTLTLDGATNESEDNLRIAPPLKVSDCSQITDGGAALVLCSGHFLKRLSRPVSMRLLGYGHTTDCLPLDKKDAPDFAIARRAAEQAYGQAGLKPLDIQAAEVHDCFSISEILAYEILGFARPGEGLKLLESGATALPAVRSQLELRTANSGQPRRRSHGRRSSRRRQRRSPGGRSSPATGRNGGRAPGPRGKVLSHVQHGRQRHDERRDDLGKGYVKRET